MEGTAPQFSWRLGAEPPEIEPHSDAKLRLLRAYLDRYFDVVCALPQMDRLRIALVDAFSGGGLFRGQDRTDRFGSPLVMIDAVARAQARVNSGRRKPLHIEAKFFFTDQNADAVEFLHETLASNDLCRPFRDQIIVCEGTASDILPSIVHEIAQWIPSGRSLFFLDQCGYRDAPHRDVRLIYQSLPKSEVIVTYNFGAVYDYMHDSAKFLAAMAPFELSADHLRALLNERDRQAGRYFAGRLLGRLFKSNVGSRFASRFFLRSESAGRDMWLVHYSKVTRSRLVMSEAHWAIKNASVTQGEAGLDMLGFLPSWEDQIPLDFGFEQADEGRIHTALMSDLLRWLEQFDPDAAPTMDTLLALSADDTAATESQFHRALAELESDGEIEILTPTGAQKRPLALLRPGHRILLPRQRRFVGF